MASNNKHVRAAIAHLERATAPSFLDDTIKGLLEHIDVLEKEADELTSEVGARVCCLEKHAECGGATWWYVRMEDDGHLVDCGCGASGMDRARKLVDLVNSGLKWDGAIDYIKHGVSDD